MEQNIKGRSRANTKDRINKAAADVFLEKGYRLASVDEIAERAGVTKRTLYKHFASKLALFIDMFDAHLLKLEQELLSSTTGVNSISRKDIIQSYRALFNFTLENQKFFRLFWILDQHEFEGEIPGELVEHVKDVTNRIMSINESVINRACNSGIMVDIDPNMLVHLFSAINKGIFIHTNKEKHFEIAEIDPGELFNLLLLILDKGLFKETANNEVKP